MIDIVLPKNNEKEFIKTAEVLGYKSLLFLYDPKNFPNKLNFETNANIEIFKGIIIYKDENKINPSLKKECDLIISCQPEDIRKIAEKNSADVIFGLELEKKPDFIHQRNSGLNHIICRILCEKNIYVGFFLRDLMHAEKKRQAQILGRFKQNCRLCKKYHINQAIGSGAISPIEMRNPKDISAFFESIGLDPKACKNLSSSTYSKIKSKNKEKHKIKNINCAVNNK